MFFTSRLPISTITSIVLLSAVGGHCGVSTPEQFENHEINSFAQVNEKYLPDWSSLDERPLPNWYDSSKIGIFIHWGVYSVPSMSSEWFWINWKGNPPSKLIEDYMKKNYKPGFSYQDFASDFTAEFFNATEWAEIIAGSGARYVVLTSKHHDGFALWPSKYSYSWNSMDVGPHKDIVGELSTAVRQKNLVFGLYHSMFEWFHPLYLADKSSNFTTQDFVNQKIYPELIELVNSYKPDVVWSDGDWETTSKYWRSEEFLAWLYNESPVAETVVSNDRWGSDTTCKHGGFLTCQDRYTPGKLQSRKWENAFTIDKNTWGYSRRSNLNDYLSIQELIDTIAETIALGGNVLMNIGPSKDGKINPIFQERLSQTGSWLEVNGEGIYETQPWKVCQNDTLTPKIWYTTKKSSGDLYVIMLRWPKTSTSTLYLSCLFDNVSPTSEVTLLGLPGVKLTTQVNTLKKQIGISLPDKALVDTEWGWVIKIKSK